MKQILAMALIWLGLVTGAWAQEDRLISTTGTGAVEAAPDMATITLGVTQEARLATEAMDAASAAARAVLTRVEQAGIAPRDVQTSDVSLQPVWSRDSVSNNTTPRVTGYVARNTLSIRVRDLDTLGAILDEVVQDTNRQDQGAECNGLRFSLQNPEPVIAEARAAAVKDAMARAEQLAAAAGVTLGAVRSISESGGRFRPEMMEMAAARVAADVPIAAGELSMTAQVSMVFEIAE